MSTTAAAFVYAQLLRACATLGIRLIHSRPGRPEGRGKIERFFRTVRDQFLVEVAPTALQVTRSPSSTSCSPRGSRPSITARCTPKPSRPRWSGARGLASAPPPLPAPDQLHEAFLWSERRTVTKTATVSLLATPTRSTPPSSAASRADLRPLRPDPHRGPLAGRPRRDKRSRSSSAATPTPPPGPSSPPRPPRRPGSTTYTWSTAAHDAELDRRDLLRRHQRPAPRPARPWPAAWPAHHRRSPHRRRPGGTVSIEKLQAHYGFTRSPSARTSPRPCCTATPPTPRPSPASPGASTSRPRRHHRRSRRRQDRRRARRPRQPRHLPPHRHLPRQPRRRRPRPQPRHRHRARRRPPLPPRHPHPPGDGPARRRGRRTRPHPVLVIDEAHLLDPDQLEELRLLTNHDMDSASPLACLLIGQPTLRRRIKLGTFAALDQRIALRYAMPGMTPEEPPATSPTTSHSPAGPTPCSATTPSP